MLNFGGAVPQRHHRPLLTSHPTPLARFSPLSLGLALCLLGAVSCQKPSSASETTSEPITAEEQEKPAILVRVRPVTTGRITKELSATANVESLDVVDVMPERSEPVTQLFVEEGDVVVAGAELAKLRDVQAQLAVAEANVRVKEAFITMQQAQRELERDQKLVEEQGPTGVLADRDLESRRQTFAVAETAHESTLVALEEAKVGLAQCTLTAPISGTVTFRDISLGDMVAVGTRVFQITDLASPKVILYRPQRELDSLRVGQELTVTAEAMPGKVISGKIERIAPIVDQETGMVKVTCALVPEPGQVIPTGILVRLQLILEVHENAILVPKQALLFEGEETYCFVVQDNVATRTVIHPGFENDDSVEVPAEDGLKPEDQVVVVGGDKLADGDVIEVAAE